MMRLYSYPVFFACLLFVLFSCQKEISFEKKETSTDSLPIILPPPSSPDTIGINTWQFVDSNNKSFHHGIIDTIETLFDVNPLWNYLKIIGWPANSYGVSNDTILLTGLFLPHSFIEPGNYDINSGVGGDHVFGFGNNTILPPYGSNQNFCYYIATPANTSNFAIRIISYDTDHRLLKGSFYGQLTRRASITDYITATHTISGSFYLRLK